MRIAPIHDGTKFRDRGHGAVLALALTADCLGRLSAAPSKGDEILARTAAYVAGFIRRFSRIVVED